MNAEGAAPHKEGIVREHNRTRSLQRARACKLASSPGPLFIFCFERAWCAKMHHVTSLWTSMGVSMETPPFTMISFLVSWLTQSDQSDFSIGGVYFSYTPPRRCIFFAWGLDLLRIRGPWYKSVTSLGSMQVSPV